LCYSESKIVIKLLSDYVNEWYYYAAIICNIKELISIDRTNKLFHTLREGNTCANYFAKIGAHNHDAYSPLVVPQDGMSHPLLADASETLFSR
jgi:hypothetical protein